MRNLIAERKSFAEFRYSLVNRPKSNQPYNHQIRQEKLYLSLDDLGVEPIDGMTYFAYTK